MPSPSEYYRAGVNKRQISEGFMASKADEARLSELNQLSDKRGPALGSFVASEVIKGRWLMLAGLIMLCLGIGISGSYFTVPEIAGWYKTLNKPAWTPPAWLFGPVWTSLYLMMATSAWLVWQRVGTIRSPQLAIFALQLTFNALWSWLFFKLHSPALAFIDIMLLWSAIAATIALFYRVNRAAALLLIPYLIWVSYAGALNFAIWRLN